MAYVINNAEGFSGRDLKPTFELCMMIIGYGEWMVKGSFEKTAWRDLAKPHGYCPSPSGDGRGTWRKQHPESSEDTNLTPLPNNDPPIKMIQPHYVVSMA
ncbi:hypothetical protein PABG_11551 [Paracoccidioides brasiliensis Pb03]|nr:hypothetical protein PABG_11551 [Paracoccidioides brasiliensis Pb03]ODH49371.1 hypothetical protein GX48_04456 [Paracoccidioides brasiliensis]